MQVIQLTQPELNGLKEQITTEMLTLSKCQDYAAKAVDPEIRQMCQSLAQMHQNHCNTLIRTLGQATQGQMMQ